MKEAKETLNNLIIPNDINHEGTLVFCDDSDIAGQPNPNFAPDIRVLCAIQINQIKYGVVRQNLLQLLQGRELHTIDVVSGKSSWAGIALQVLENTLNQVKNPNSEIVKRMTSFSEKSPEILKPILEG